MAIRLEVIHFGQFRAESEFSTAAMSVIIRVTPPPSETSDAETAGCQEAKPAGSPTAGMNSDRSNGKVVNVPPWRNGWKIAA